jgi:hypothetical protein
MIHNIPQPVFEGFMADVLGTDPNVEIRKGLSFVSLEEVRPPQEMCLVFLY